MLTDDVSSNTKQSFSFSINEYQLRLGRQTRGVQVKLWDPLRTRAIPERLRGVFSVHDKALYKCTITFTFAFTFRWNGGWWRNQVYLSHFGWCWISDLIVLPPDCWIITSFPHAHWNREVQITKFVKQWIPAQLHSEADAWKDGKIRPHIRPDMKIWLDFGRGRIWYPVQPYKINDYFLYI